jgi:hypothetical protein
LVLILIVTEAHDVSTVVTVIEYSVSGTNPVKETEVVVDVVVKVETPSVYSIL